MGSWQALRRAGRCCLFLLVMGAAAGGNWSAAGRPALAGTWTPPPVGPVWQEVRPFVQQVGRQVERVDEFIVFLVDDMAEDFERVDKEAALERARAAWSTVWQAVRRARWPDWLAAAGTGGDGGMAPAAGALAGATGPGAVPAGSAGDALPGLETGRDTGIGAAAPASEELALPVPGPDERRPAGAAGRGDQTAESSGQGSGRQAGAGRQPGGEERDGTGDDSNRAEAGRDDRPATAPTAPGPEESGREEQEARPASAPASTSPPAPASAGGAPWHDAVASWYGPGFYGRPTASGEIFTGRDFTAAHRSLPFGTILIVHYPATGRTVRVRINDRGPFVEGRDLDLSEAAAEALGMISAGVARVRYQIVEQGG